MATWPGTLPTFQHFLVDGFLETAPYNVIRTEMEIGPAKIRRRGTAAPEVFSGAMHLTTAQVATFRTFYDSTVNYGADAFDTVHPRTGSSVSARFIGPPQVVQVGGDWRLAFEFEVLP